MKYEPRDLLSADAKQRISEAHRAADELLHAEGDRRRLDGACKVIHVLAREYVAAGANGEQLAAIKSLEIEGAVYSLDLHDWQGAIEAEWDLAASETAARPAIGQILCEARKRYGQTQAATADKLGISERYLQMIESGERSPGADVHGAIMTYANGR